MHDRSGRGIRTLHLAGHVCAIVLLGSTARYPLTTKADSGAPVNAVGSSRHQFHKALEQQDPSKQGETTDIPEPAMPFLVGTGLITFSVTVRKLRRYKAS